MSRLFSLQGVLTLSHLGLVVATILFARSLEGPNGSIHVDSVPSYLVKLRDFFICFVSLPLAWIFLFPTHTGGPSHFDILLTSVALGLNSMLVGYMLAQVLSRASTPADPPPSDADRFRGD